MMLPCRMPRYRYAEDLAAAANGARDAFVAAFAI
jgi:hypothetical protein